MSPRLTTGAPGARVAVSMRSIRGMNTMGRPKIYEDNAARQRAYRARLKEKERQEAEQQATLEAAEKGELVADRLEVLPEVLPDGWMLVEEHPYHYVAYSTEHDRKIQHTSLKGLIRAIEIFLETGKAVDRIHDPKRDPWSATSPIVQANERIEHPERFLERYSRLGIRELSPSAEVEPEAPQAQTAKASVDA